MKFVPLRRLFAVVNGGTPAADASNWDGDVLWATPVDLAPVHGGRIGETARRLSAAGLRTGSRSVPAGSLLVSTRAPVGYVAETARSMSFNQGCRGLVPVQDLDVRYFRYQLVAATEQLQSLGQGSTFVELSTDALASFPVSVTSLLRQRAIADYLDAETARIDELIAKKRHMIEVLDERGKALFVEALHQSGGQFPDALDASGKGWMLPTAWRVVRLSQVLVQLTNGFVGPTRDILVDEGVPYIQSLHIKNGVIDFHRRPFYVTKEWHDDRPRIHLRRGDVLIVQTGDIGQVAVVPEGFGEASCHALQIARVRPEMVTGPYLGEYLRSPFGLQSLLCRATGALHPHLEGGIRDVPVVVPPLQVQDGLVRVLAARRSRLKRLVAALEYQINLLVEHRQALITAAVTGKLEIPGVAA